MPGGAAPLRVDIITDADGVAALAGEWSALFAAAAAPSPSQRHGFVMLAGRLMAPADWRVFAVREAGRLVAVWPLQVRRQGGVRVARHIGACHNEEYAGPLIAGDADAGAVVAAMLAGLRDHADVLWVYNVRASTPLAAALAGGGLGSARENITSPIIRSAAFASHRDWLKAQSANLRAALGNARRRLATVGRLESVLVAPEDAADFCDWLIATKRSWASTRGLRAPWLDDPRTAAFYTAALADRPGTGAFAQALRLDGRFIAAVLCFDGAKIEVYVTTFDPASARYSPGSLVFEDRVADAIATNRDIDLRVTFDDYKRRWASETESRETLCVALTPLGLPALWAERSRLAWKANRRRIGGLLRRWGLR